VACSTRSRRSVAPTRSCTKPLAEARIVRCVRLRVRD
jgi:hypothetical protein